jgi:fibronectin-binding autotransporter adhesin
MARGANFAWDPTPGDNVVTGGNGTWDSFTPNWTTNGGGTNVAYTNNSDDAATFSGDPGTVTLGQAINANALTFNVTGYTITGFSTLTMSGSTPTISVASGASAAIVSNLGGSSGFTLSGGGTLNLAGNVSVSGGLTVSHGTLVFDASDFSAFNSSNSLTMNGQAAFKYIGSATTSKLQDMGGVSFAGGDTQVQCIDPGGAVTTLKFASLRGPPAQPAAL